MLEKYILLNLIYSYLGMTKNNIPNGLGIFYFTDKKV